MAFDVAAEAYDRYMGGYSRQLSPQMADLAGVHAGQRVLDVGCGPGALTEELVRRVGGSSVTAVDPSASFVAAARKRHPGVSVKLASAEALPFPDQAFDAALAQLVVHFMTDPVQGIREMARVTRRGGVVAACVWDHSADSGPLSLFWRATRMVDPESPDEADLPGARQGDLQRLFEEAGLHETTAGTVSANREHATFDAWWDLFLLGVGPAGLYLRSRSPEEAAALREQARALVPGEPFVVQAVAWAARGIA